MNTNDPLSQPADDNAALAEVIQDLEGALDQDAGKMTVDEDEDGDDACDPLGDFDENDVE